MKILNKDQIYEADKATEQAENIPSFNLMERAGGYAFHYLHQRLQNQPVAIKIFCGTGNNGGDGLVIARNLIENGYNVTTYVVNYSENRSKDFLDALDALKSKTKNWPLLIKSENDFPELAKEDLIIDCIFGIGINRPAETWVQNLFKKINESRAYILAIDVPSGMAIDRLLENEEVVRPTVVLTFQTPKLVFFLPQGGKYINSWEVLDIGLDRNYLNSVETKAQLIGKAEAQHMYKPRAKFSHKGTYGHSLLIAGSYGKMGAAVLCSKAALSSGSGLVTTYVTRQGLPILQAAVPEVMVVTDRHNGDYLEEIKFDLQPDVIGIGPGLGMAKSTVSAFKTFLEQNKTQLVLDADALNMLSEHKELLDLLPKYSVLTPHPKELERLIGSWDDDFDKLAKAEAFSEKYNCILVLKDAHTIVVFEGKYYVNNSGNPGLATGGSGDVLTGVITGLIAQNYDPLTAAIFGVYIHGRAADIAINHTGYEGLTAGVIIEFLGQAYLDLFSEPEKKKN
ncbi:NAD(P)H-hydrate dehydratase [Leeuwenhoekiella sp. W20_SRS_FM14]|uniref:NAD(P)H-hydrate dehydratase n=1 Tax=Leeuwenhoekiella sp. W20_SRS_FM14 TaxID=3240270 RepID=UPI003F981FCF